MRPITARRPGRRAFPPTTHEGRQHPATRGERATATLTELLVESWRQTLAEGREEVLWEGRRFRVGRTRSQGLRTVALLFGEKSIEGIEQNPEKTSRWAQLAREGKRIMQYRYRGRYIANVCEGVVLRYPAWKGFDLPE